MALNKGLEHLSVMISFIASIFDTLYQQEMLPVDNVAMLGLHRQLKTVCRKKTLFHSYVH